MQIEPRPIFISTLARLHTLSDIIGGKYNLDVYRVSEEEKFHIRRDLAYNLTKIN